METCAALSLGFYIYDHRKISDFESTPLGSQTVRDSDGNILHLIRREKPLP